MSTFQVIQDEDLVAILKDVSGDNYHEDNRTDYNDCDKRLRNLDFVNDPEMNDAVRLMSAGVAASTRSSRCMALVVTSVTLSGFTTC